MYCSQLSSSWDIVEKVALYSLHPLPNPSHLITHPRTPARRPPAPSASAAQCFVSPLLSPVCSCPPDRCASTAHPRRTRALCALCSARATAATHTDTQPHAHRSENAAALRANGATPCTRRGSSDAVRTECGARQGALAQRSAPIACRGSQFQTLSPRLLPFAQSSAAPPSHQIDATT